jgi:hypothetical protein
MPVSYAGSLIQNVSQIAIVAERLRRAMNGIAVAHE